MKQTAHSVNSSKNLLLVNNNPNRENTDISNESYSHDTNEDKHINDDIQNQSYNYNSLNNNFNISTRTNNSNNLSFNNNNLIMNTINNSPNNNINSNNNSVLVSNTSNINNSFSLNNNSTRNLLGNNTMNSSMNQLRQSAPLLNTSFNNSFNNNNNTQNLQTPSTNIINPVLPSPTPPNNNNNNNNSMNNSVNNSFNNINTGSHNMKILNPMNSMDIPVTTPVNNRVSSSPPVPPLALGKDDSEYEEEKDNQMVIVIDPSTLLLPVNEVTNENPDPKKIPNSVEDWINYHAAIVQKDPQKQFLSPNEPPSKIPILESMIPLDEVITPQRSVSCRIRLLQQQRRKKAQELAEQEKLMHHSNSKSLNNVLNNDAIVYSSPSIKMPSAVRSSKKMKSENSNMRNGTPINTKYSTPKNPPRFQLCTYNKCEWIATNKCEKCSNLCCLDHSHRFYYFLPSLFSPKYYCPDCMKSVSNFWKWAYLIIALSFCAILILFPTSTLSSLNFTTDASV